MILVLLIPALLLHAGKLKLGLRSWGSIACSGAENSSTESRAEVPSGIQSKLLLS